MKIIFIRHSESENNVINLKSCSVDKHPLTSRGRKTVEKIRQALNEKVDAIYSSPILRTKETAKILNEKLNQKIIYDKLITEYDWGSWNEKTKEELIKNSKKYRNYVDLTPEERFCYNFGENKKGEARKEVVGRVRKFLEKLIKNYPDKTILVVSHSGINAAFHRILREASIEEYFQQERLEHNAIQCFTLDEKGNLIDYKKTII